MSFSIFSCFATLGLLSAINMGGEFFAMWVVYIKRPKIFLLTHDSISSFLGLIPLVHAKDFQYGSYQVTLEMHVCHQFISDSAWNS